MSTITPHFDVFKHVKIANCLIKRDFFMAGVWIYVTVTYLNASL